mgnify:CR=1
MQIDRIIYPDSGISELLKLRGDQSALLFKYNSNTEQVEKKVSKFLEKVFAKHKEEVTVGDTYVIVPTKKLLQFIKHLRTAARILPSDNVDLVEAASREIEASKKKRSNIN